MEDSVIRQIHRLKQMTIGELRIEWQRLCGEPARSNNRDHLWRRLAWRVQELALGGLSDRARARLAELAPDRLMRARVPNLAALAADPAPSPPSTKVRDMRMPSPGSVLTRQYHGREIRVTTLDDGFEWDGRRYGSLSEVARAVTGQHWSGPLFFGLRKRSGRG